MSEDDKKAAEAADLQLDAERGWELMREVSRHCWQVGYDAAADGLPIDHPALWSSDHRDGWMAAMREADLAIDEAQYTPRPGIDF